MKKFYILFSALLLTMYSFAQLQLPLDFESATANYTFTDFAGGATTKIANPQINGINTSANVAKMVKGAGEVYGGSTITLTNPIDFTVNKTFKVKVFSPRVGAKLLLKIENATDGAINFEKEVTSTVANTWEDLTFDYSGISTTNQYSKLVFIFDNGTAGNGSANFTWLFDDVRLTAAGGGGGGTTTLPVLPMDFESATVNYAFTDFGGGATTKIANPQSSGINTSANVAKMVKGAGEVYGGSAITLASPIDLSVNKTFKVKVFSPRVGAKLLLKVENADGSATFEKEATSTVANAWEDLTFDYSTASTTAQYIKLVFIFDLGTAGNGSANFTWLFDDVRLTAAGGGGGGGLTQMNLPVTFDDATVNYGVVGFEGAEQSTIVTDPTLATNKVVKVIKTNTAQLYAGTTVTAVTGGVQTGFSANIPFTATEKRMNVRVYSPHAGIQVRLKVEDKNDPTKSCETEATVTTANGWQTLEFNFANQAAGTAAFNLAFNYNKATIFFNFGVTGAVAGERIYYFDDVKFGPAAGGGGGGSTLPVLPLDFESGTLNYAFTDFGGGATTKIANPQINGINTSVNVAKMVKGAGEVYGGSFITLASPIDLSVNKTFKVKVYSPRVGAKLLLKVENADGSSTFEKEATSTVANAWEDLTFDYSAISTSNQYSKLVFIFDLGTAGNGTANYTWLFDDVRLTGSGGGGSSTLPVLPLDFESATINYGFTDFGGGATTKIANPQISGINTSANVAKMVKGAGEVYGGSAITLASPINLSVNKTFEVKVYSPRVGAKLLLKVENADGSATFEKEATSTVANAWEDLTFDYSTASTTAQYVKLVFIFDLGTAGNGSANFTWLFDDVRLVEAGGGGGGLTQMNLPVTFDDATVSYGLVGFAGAEQSTIVADPTLATNKVAKVIRTNTAETYAGTTITALNGAVQTGFSSNIPFTATEKRMNVRVYSPHAGIQVRLKVEDKNDPTKSCETEATVTTANGWQTLEFNFSNQAAGTAALNLTYNLNKATIFFNFGVTGAVAGERTYYFDDVKFGAATLPPAPPAPIVTTPVLYCQNSTAVPLTATALAGNTLSWYTVAVAGTASADAPTPSTTAVGTTNYYVSQKNTAGTEGPRATIAVTINALPQALSNSTVTYCQNATAIPLTATAGTGNILKWYSVATGGVGSNTAPMLNTATAGTTIYYVSQVSSNGCEGARASITITVIAPPSATVIAASPGTQVTPGQIITIATSNAAGAGNSYSWFRNGILIPTQTGVSIPVNIDGVGTYTLKVLNANSCVTTSNTINITEASSEKLFVYPNPSTGKFQVRYFSDPNNLQPLQIAIYNSAGALVFSGKFTIFSSYTPMNIDLTKHGNGVYHIRLMNSNGKILKTETIIIHK